MTDTEIKVKGFEILTKELGEIQAERFISLILREPFDYTKRQKNLFRGKSVEDISKSAMNFRNHSTL